MYICMNWRLSVPISACDSINKFFALSRACVSTETVQSRILLLSNTSFLCSTLFVCSVSFSFLSCHHTPSYASVTCRILAFFLTPCSRRKMRGKVNDFRLFFAAIVVIILQRDQEQLFWARQIS